MAKKTLICVYCILDVQGAMSFLHPCFISYTTGQYDLMSKAVRDLHDALRNELDALVKKDIYFAEERLEAGNIPEKQMAQALCGSVCLVMLYTPRYFDDEDVWCTREFCGMEALEDQRFKTLGIERTSANGLIIPVILRGFDRLPKKIKEERHCYIFDSTYTTASGPISQSPDHMKDIVRMAKYIADRCLELKSSPGLFSECAEYELPTEEEAAKFAASMMPQPLDFPVLGTMSDG